MALKIGNRMVATLFAETFADFANGGLVRESLSCETIFTKMIICECLSRKNPFKIHYSQK